MTSEFLDEFPELRVDISITEEERSVDQHAFENMKGMFGVGELDLTDMDMMSSAGGLNSSSLYSSRNGQPVS